MTKELCERCLYENREVEATKEIFCSKHHREWVEEEAN